MNNLMEPLPDKLARILVRHYGLTPTRVELLEGYEDRTYLVRAGEDRYILKYQGESESLRERIELEDRLTRSLAQEQPFDFPLHIRSLEGRLFLDENNVLVRLLSYLDGEFLAETPHSGALLESLGDFLGRLNLVSRKFSPGILAGKVSPWDLQFVEQHRKNLPAIEDPEDRALISHFLLQFELEVLPRKYEIRKAIIHNDANDWNVLTRRGRVSGIIDFGDMCHSWLMGELAVALPYVLAESEDPLSDASRVIWAYHKHLPLEELELSLLYYLIAGRMCMSLCNSARAKKERPGSDYISISEASMRNLLRKWVGISPEKARDVFMEAVGLDPPPVREPEMFLQRRANLMPPSLSISYKQPIVMRRAAFQYMFDQTGRTLLDAYNNIMLVGHCHPKVVQATSRTLGRLNTNTRYLYDELLDYGERLLELFPSALSRIFLVNSGSAATDLALRLSRAHTDKAGILAIKHGYHGNTAAGISVSHYKHKKGEIHPNTILGPMPKVFGSGLPDDGTAGTHFARQYLALLEQCNGGAAAFIAEPVMGCGGQVPLPKGFLNQVYEAVRNQGGICISDEVQVGFGRLGQWNWGYEMYDVQPDLVILGKPMGNGHPIGAVITTEAVASSFDSGPEFFSSFGGNPVSCAAGLAVLEVLEEEGLRERAADTGTWLKEAFRGLQEVFPGIGDVRGEGLFLGVELITADGQPDTRAAQVLKNQLRESYILIGTDGPSDNVLKIKPPLPFNRNNCDSLIRETSRILKNLGKY
jgi:4-aminobutyrate aminotransferase-like enzyme/Ser/Thr protein kinase RdoA (MazF antagonist)